MHYIRKSLIALIGLALIQGCYPGGPEYVDDYDLIVTDYDSDYNFTGKTTYALIDSVVHIGDDDDLDREFDQDILARIDMNLMARGYEKYDTASTPSNTPPDILVRASAFTLSGNVTYCDYYPGYGWGWWGGWGYWWGGYPGYGYGYPYCFTGYQYDIGTVAIDIVDLTNPNDEDSTLSVVWTGLLNGLASGRTSVDQQRVVEGIDQAFDQSPYLKP